MINDRDYIEFAYSEFDYTDIDCPVYFSAHVHLININPNIGNFGLRPTYH